ncbi:MAG: alpha/beta hydrolase fold domain-containing protein [Bacteroidetes bacterium]|nr:alpha/beta hydrolase fold domain-containing protein [Bacteroidota bacterium]
MKNVILPFILVVLFALNSKAQTATYTNLDYAGNGNSKQMLDLYIPSTASATNLSPLIIHIHGGAFLMGSKGSSEVPSFATFYNNGYVCADINYRLSTDSLWPAQVYDCKAAVRFLKAHAKQYYIDTCKIAVIGESAGGYLVSMLGTTEGVASLEGLHLGNTNVSSRVHAVVDLFGPINFLTMDAEAAVLGFAITTNSATSPESNLMGAAVQTIPERVALANPRTYISGDDAAFFISAGSADMNIPYTQWQNFYNALLPVIGTTNAVFELAAGQAHGGSFWHTAAQDGKYLAFVNAKLANGCNPSEINNPNINNKFNISPNPIHDNLNIELPENQVFDLYINNITGQNVMQLNNIKDGTEISLNKLPEGFYFVKAINNKNQYSTKVLKN